MVARHTASVANDPRRRSWRMTAAVGISALVGAALLVTSGPASAADGLTWTDTIGFHGYLTLSPNGGVLVNEDHLNGGAPPSGGDSLVDIAANGSVNWRTPYVSGDQILSLPVTDAKGDSYRWQKNSTVGGTGSIIASRGTTTRWSIPAPATGASAIVQLVIGGNGQVYALANGKLYGFDATTSTSLFDPVTPTALPSPASRIYAFDAGLVLDDGANVEYFDQEGKPTSAKITIAESVGAPSHQAVSATGDIFVATSPTPSTSTCQGDAKVSLNKLTRSGLAWTKPAAPSYPCSTLGRVLVAATPNGGAVMAGFDSDGAILVQGFGSDGGQLWNKTIPAVAGAFSQLSGLYTPRVDTDGQIVILDSSSVDCQLTADVCDFVRVNRLNSSGGIVNQSLLMGPSSAPQQSWDLWEGDADGNGVALSPGQVIVSLAHANGGRNSDTLDYQIGALTMPGLGLQYPQAALWKLMPGGTSTPTPSATTTPNPTPTDSTPPVVVAVSQLPASGMDPMLVRNFKVTATDDVQGSGVSAIEYAWIRSPANPSVVAPDARLTYPGTGVVPVSFRTAGPSGAWNLYVRAIDKAGNTGNWFIHRISKTPPKPTLVALGDSITSGHHKDGSLALTNCNDPNYGYPAYVFATIQASLPSRWRGGGYNNFARSGFSTSQVLDGKRTDVCGKAYKRGHTPIRDAIDQLQAGAGSWNRVVATAGIDNTDWTTVLSGVYVLHKVYGDLYTAAACDALVNNWNGWTSTTTPVARDVREIATRLSQADAAMRLIWIGYYNPAGTGFVTPACDSAFQRAGDTMNGAIQIGLLKAKQSRSVLAYQWIDSNAAIHGFPDRVQDWWPNDWTQSLSQEPSGWPHPNQAGAKAIAGLIAG